LKKSAGCCQQKGGFDGNQKGVSSLQPAKENQHFYIKKTRACKGQRLTGCLKGIMILDRRKSEIRENEKQDKDYFSHFVYLSFCTPYFLPTTEG
jgi:hypothetical protein